MAHDFGLGLSERESRSSLSHHGTSHFHFRSSLFRHWLSELGFRLSLFSSRLLVPDFYQFVPVASESLNLIARSRQWVWATDDGDSRVFAIPLLEESGDGRDLFEGIGEAIWFS